MEKKGEKEAEMPEQMQLCKKLITITQNKYT